LPAELDGWKAFAESLPDPLMLIFDLDWAWAIAAGEDLRFPSVEGTRPLAPWTSVGHRLRSMPSRSRGDRRSR